MCLGSSPKPPKPPKPPKIAQQPLPPPPPVPAPPPPPPAAPKQLQTSTTQAAQIRNSSLAGPKLTAGSNRKSISSKSKNTTSNSLRSTLNIGTSSGSGINA